MKKFLIFLACTLLFIGASLYHSGIGAAFHDAILTLYDGDNIIYEGQTFRNDNKNVQRLDIKGSFEASELLNIYDAVELWREEFEDDLSVIYAFSPMMGEKTTVKGETVNLMIALRPNTAIIGMPIIKGSY